MSKLIGYVAIVTVEILTRKDCWNRALDGFKERFIANFLQWSNLLSLNNSIDSTKSPKTIIPHIYPKNVIYRLVGYHLNQINQIERENTIR